jgi:hypothetical protein
MMKSRDFTASQLACLAHEAIEQVKVRILPDGRMSRQDAARYLGHKPKTLAMWTLLGKGPRSVKVGGRIFYFRSDLDAFVRGEAGALMSLQDRRTRQRTGLLMRGTSQGEIS